MEQQGPTYEYAFNPEAANDTAATVYRLARDGGSKVLDLGSGPAIVSSHLQRVDGRHVTCVDSDSDRLAVAKERGVDRVIKADLESSDWTSEVEGERFDVIILADVLEHLKAPEEILRLIRERELLALDGFLVISIPNAAHEAIVAELLGDQFRYRESGLLDATHIRFFTRATFVALLESEGFTVSALHRTLIPLERVEMQSALDGVSPRLREALATLPEGGTYQFVVRAEPSTDTLRVVASQEQRRQREEERERYVAANEAISARWAELAAARAEVTRVSAENGRLKQKLASVYASSTWRAGRVVVGVARFVVRPRTAIGRIRGRRDQTTASSSDQSTRSGA